MLNQVILIGRLTKDPELRYTPSGKAVCNFTLAVDRGARTQNNESQADFVDCVVWDRAAEAAANNLAKGRLIAFTGAIRTRTYQASDGSKRKVTEVHGTFKFLPDGRNRRVQNDQLEEQPPAQETANGDEFVFVDDEDVPF